MAEPLPDSYLTISAPSTGEFKDRGSKFLAYAFPVTTAEEWQTNLEAIKKEHPKARHHCFAYRLGLNGNNFRANDDGEPSGTAGRPILGQIDSLGLVNVFVVVVRYFGGTLLGTSGLINAYKSSASAALDAANIIEKLVEDVFLLSIDYSLVGDAMDALKKLETHIIKQEFGEKAFLEIAIRQKAVQETLLKLNAFVGKTSLEQAAATQKVDGMEVKYLHTR